MRRLLDLELAKLAPARDVRLSAAAYALLVTIAVASLRGFTYELPNASAGINPFAFPDVWQNTAYVASWVDYLLYVIALQAITHEYQFRTNRQNVVDGLRRTEYVAGKILLLLALALVATALVVVLALGFGLTYGGRSADVLTGARAAAFYGLQVFGYLMLALFIGTLVRRTGVAVLAFVGYTLLAEPLLRGLALPHGAGRALPSAAFAALVPNPFFGYVGMRVIPGIASSAIVFSVLFVLGLAAASLWTFGKQDL